MGVVVRHGGRYFALVLLTLSGLVGFRRAVSVEPPTPQGGAALKLASWNLAWLNRVDCNGKIPRAGEDYARLASYASRLDADIVALQEVDGEEAARRVFSPSTYTFHFTADEGYLQRTGFAYKKNLRVIPQPDLTELAIGGTRRGADVEVELGRTRLRLLSIHLKSGCWGEPIVTEAPACDILRAQLPVLEHWIDARAAEKVPFAVLGDFNRRFEPPDTFWPEIDDADPPNADLFNVTEGKRSECWGGEYPQYVDHIVFDKLATAWVVPRSFGQVLYEPEDIPHKELLSDHCPIAVSLAIGGVP